MKSTLFILFLLGNLLIGQSSAAASATIIDQNFGHISADDFANAGWKQSSGRGRPCSFPTGDYVASNNWGQNQIWTTLSADNSIKLGTENALYTFDFSVYSSAIDVQNLFCLSGDGFSLFLGTSYSASSSVDFGTKNISWEGDSWNSFDTTISKMVPSEHSGTMVSNSKPLTYQFSLATTATGSNTLVYTVTDGTNTYTATHSFDSTATLDQLGFLFDGATGTNGISSIKATKSLSVPEPATASLALLGVASFFIRRRRA